MDGRMCSMRIFFKIILFPISLVLTIIVAVSSFLIEKAAFILYILSCICFLGAILAFIQYFTGWPYSQAGSSYDLYFGIAWVVIGLILTPYGLPRVLATFIGLLARLNDRIKAI